MKIKNKKNLSRALFQWSGGDANQFFFTWPKLRIFFKLAQAIYK